MKEWYQKLNIYHKTGIWSLICGIITLILLIPLFFFGLKDIPLGIVLGSSFGALFYFLIGFNQKKECNKKGMILDIVLIILRFVFFALALVGLALLYYLGNVRIFNIFGFTGAYLFGLLIYLFLSRKEGTQ